MTQEAPRPTPSPTQRFFGALLIAVGVLMMVVCGLCSLAVLGVFVSEGGGKMDGLIEGVMAVVVFGGIPFVMGLGLFIAGRALRKP